jgi:hypothetical protein
LSGILYNMKMSTTDINSNRCEFQNTIRLYSNQSETIKLFLDIDIRKEQLRIENLKANRKCYCEKCNPETYE